MGEATTTTRPARSTRGLSAEDRKEVRRRQILDGALVVFAEKGFHDTGIQDIAKRLGLGHGTFYRYFKNKEDIFHALLDEMIEKIQEMVDKERPDAPSDLEEYREQCFRIGGEIAVLFFENRELAQILLREAVGLNNVVDEKVDQAMELCVAMTRRYVENGVAKGFLRDDLDVEISARCINSMIFEIVRLLLRDPESQQMTVWARTVSSLFIDGLRAR